MKSATIAIFLGLAFLLGYHFGGDEAHGQRDRMELEEDARKWQEVPDEIKLILEMARKKKQTPMRLWSPTDKVEI
jgi:hypothetical protein